MRIERRRENDSIMHYNEITATLDIHRGDAYTLYCMLFYWHDWYRKLYKERGEGFL